MGGPAIGLVLAICSPDILYSSLGLSKPFSFVSTARVKSLISPEEPITPGILYVGVAALSGSVFARGRTCLLSQPLRDN